MNEQIWWYVARSGGIVALVLSALSVIWGLFYSTRILQGRPTPKWLLDLHKFLGGAAVTFTGVHIAGLVLDSYVQFGWLEILVPFASAWNPFSVALGVVAMYLLIAVQITSMFMRKIPRTWWKRIHLTSYAMFWLGVLHGALAGTDAGNPLYVAGMALLTLAVVFLTGYRSLTAKRKRSSVKREATPEPTTLKSAAPPVLAGAAAALVSPPVGDAPEVS